MTVAEIHLIPYVFFSQLNKKKNTGKPIDIVLGYDTPEEYEVRKFSDLFKQLFTK